MSGLFEHISQFDNGQRTASRQAAAVAQKRVADQFGEFFKVAKSPEELAARYDFAEERLHQIVADVAEEYDADVENLESAIEDHIKGEGVTDLDKELEEAPSAVGEKAASGNGHRSDCNCGFCANAGSFGNQEETEEETEESPPVEASTKEADAPKDGGGAVKREDLPTGDGKSIGTQPSPKMDKRTWKPNALNENGNLKPVDAEMDGSPHPTEETDVSELPDHSNDFLEQTDAVTESQTLPTATDFDAETTERNISQDSQGGTWTEAQNDPVTASTDPDQNPLRSILESGFETDNQVESAIAEYEAEKE